MNTTTAALIAAEQAAPTPSSPAHVWVVKAREHTDTETFVGVFRTRLGALLAIAADDAALVEDLAEYEQTGGGIVTLDNLWTQVTCDETTGEAVWSNDDNLRFLEQTDLGA